MPAQLLTMTSLKRRRSAADHIFHLIPVPREYFFYPTTRDREDLSSTQYHEHVDASTLDHFKTADIHSHFTEGVNYGWMLYHHDICFTQSGQISIIYEGNSVSKLQIQVATYVF
jgi:hypothetical protein